MTGFETTKNDSKKSLSGYITVVFFFMMSDKVIPQKILYPFLLNSKLATLIINIFKINY